MGAQFSVSDFAPSSSSLLHAQVRPRHADSMRNLSVLFIDSKKFVIKRVQRRDYISEKNMNLPIK